MKVLACIGALVAVQLLGGVEGHGFVITPPSRVFLCSVMGGEKNKGCKHTAQGSCQNSARFPDYSPFGSFNGVIASGMMAIFRELDQQGEDRWYKNRMRPGSNTFTWRLPGNHPTKDFRYWITVDNWDPNGPLQIVSFEKKPFCTVDVNGRPPKEVTHRCNVPKKTGYHIILAEWKTPSNDRSFYNVIDVDFSGNGGGGNGPAVFGLQPLTRYHDRHTRALGTSGRFVAKYYKQGQLCVGPDENDRYIIAPVGCKRNIDQNILHYDKPALLSKGGAAPKPPVKQCQKHGVYDLCTGNEGCCTGDNKCFAHSPAAAVCLPTCPAGWGCSSGSTCQVSGSYHLCKGNEGCCPRNTKCYAYSNAASACMATCPEGWACRNANRR